MFVNGGYKLIKIESSDLSGENINGISIMDKYNENEFEKKLGMVFNKVKHRDAYIFTYDAQHFIADFKVDKNNNIISIYITGLRDNALVTKKGISRGSTFSEVVQSYGSNFIKKDNIIFMGSGDSYNITYIDKNIKSKITFYFHKDNKKETISSVIFSKY